VSTAIVVPPAATACPSPAARAGAMAMAPIAVGLLPFALVIGTTVSESGAGVAGWAGSWLIFGGSAHLATMRVFDASGALVAIATALLVHARLLVYSSSLSRVWEQQPRWFRALGAALIIDPTWALATDHGGRSPAAQRSYFLAAGGVLGIGWSAGIAVGAIAGSRLDLDTLRIAAPLCLVALVAPRLAQRRERLPIAAAAAAAIATSGWPAGTTQLVAIAAGCVAGEIGDRVRR
jgi:predicted branched-subunit amino acid permease